MQNNPIRTIFVCEFITGGGLNHSDLPPELTVQGALMRDALLKDLSPLAYQVQTTVDIRLRSPTNCKRCKVIASEDDAWQVWDDEIKQCDAVWIIAPETKGSLEKMTAIALKHHKKIIGCGVSAVKIFGSKLETYQRLRQAGIPTVQTYLFADWEKSKDTQWLAKPDNGAGCEETVYFALPENLEHWILLNNKQDTHVIQPYLKGVAASISCVIYQGKAQLLSCNEQLITIENDLLNYEGCIVNGMRQNWEAFEELANKVASLLPDISAYVGIDVIVNDDDAQVTVVEVNPRLTTSYVALNESTGHNPAALIMQMCTQENYVWPNIERNVVRLEMRQPHD